MNADKLLKEFGLLFVTALASAMRKARLSREQKTIIKESMKEDFLNRVFELSDEEPGVRAN